MNLLGLPFSKGMLVAGAAAVLVIVAQGGVIVGQAKSIGSLQAKQHGYLVELAQGATDLGACRVNLAATQEAHLQCMDEIRVAQDENAAARDSIEQLVAHIKQESASVRREREVIYREPQCQELRDLDIAAVCPDLAHSLRARAAQMSPADPGGGASPRSP